MPINHANPLELPLYQFEHLTKQSGIAHGITTRHAPRYPLYREAQPDQLDQWRISGRGSVPYDQLKWRRAELLAALETDHLALLPSLTSPLQRHTANVATVGAEYYGAERTWADSIPDTDALVTNLPNLPIMTVHADCPPILFYDPVQRVIGTAHSGWRGTVARIAEATVKVMGEQYNCQPKHILAGVGPSIGVCCYQVGEPVLSEVKVAFGEEAARDLMVLQPDNSYHFDLWAAIRLSLLQSGLLPEHIEISDLCTRCHSDTFFSYRATSPEQRHDYGNFGALIVLT